MIFFMNTSISRLITLKTCYIVTLIIRKMYSPVLKVIVNNIYIYILYNAFGVNYFTQINIVSAIYNYKKRFFCYVLTEL